LGHADDLIFPIPNSPGSLLGSSHNKSMKLIEVGYWKNENFNDNRPAPKDFIVNDTKFDCRPLVAALKRNSFLHSHENGYSSCKICGLSGKVMGCCDLTDGRYVWPEGLIHYIEQHNVIPRIEGFVEHMLAYNIEGGGHDNLLMWDETIGEPIKIGKGDETWLRANTTLYYGHDNENTRRRNFAMGGAIISLLVTLIAILNQEKSK